MTSLYRIRTALTGFAGGPGVSTMYFLDVETAVASIATFWEAISDAMPTVVTIQPPAAGDIIDDTTGTITGAWTSEGATPITGNGAGLYAAPSGCVVGWETATILDGRRVRGRTFVVPLTPAAYATDGSMNDTTLASFNAAGTSLIVDQAESFVVWHRPFAGRAATDDRPAKAAHAGGHALVTNCVTPDRVAVLRSRRD